MRTWEKFYGFASISACIILHSDWNFQGLSIETEVFQTTNVFCYSINYSLRFADDFAPSFYLKSLNSRALSWAFLGLFLKKIENQFCLQRIQRIVGNLSKKIYWFHFFSSNYVIKILRNYSTQVSFDENLNQYRNIFHKFRAQITRNLFQTIQIFRPLLCEENLCESIKY